MAGKFERGTGYLYKKSLYTQDWFDSSTERDAANILEGASEVEYWLRLQIKDLPILWAQGRDYNPDFIVVESGGDHHVLRDQDGQREDQHGREGQTGGCSTLANHVNKSNKVEAKWSYLLAFEEDVKQSTGSWPALKKLAS